MTDDAVTIERQDGVLVLTLNRPAALNAWTTGMRETLLAELRAVQTDAAIGAIVLTGKGPRAFCAGQDLHEAHNFGEKDVDFWIEGWRGFYDALRSSAKPIVVALNGLAVGSAFQAVLLCDIRVGHSGVKMGQPEINSGIASVTGPWIMSQVLGMSRTVELTLTGRLMEAAECKELGLIHHLVERDKVFSEAMKIAKELAAKAPLVLKLTRQRFREMTQAGFDDAIDAAKRIHRAAFASDEPARMMEKFFAARDQQKS